MQKIVTIIIAAVLLVGAALAYFFYQPADIFAEETSVNIDKTDTFAAAPDAHAILSRLHLAQHKWQSFKVDVNTLSDMDYTVSHTMVLPSAVMLLSNPNKRETAIGQFKRNVTAQVRATSEEPIGRLTSSIYFPMIKELNRLATSTAIRRSAIFYTDAHQNTDWFSVYRKEDRELLKTNPDSIKKRFAHIATPSDLHGINVYLIFNPRTTLENENFTMMANLIKSIIENAGAYVYVGANLPEGNE